MKMAKLNYILINTNLTVLSLRIIALISLTKMKLSLYIRKQDMFMILTL